MLYIYLTDIALDWLLETVSSLLGTRLNILISHDYFMCIQ